MIDIGIPQPLKNKSVLITGSTSGIGLGIAQKLSELGFRVMINGLGDESTNETLRAELEENTGNRVIYSPADLTSLDQIEQMFEQFISEFGPIDAVVNNAGLQHVAPVENFPSILWERIIALNLTAAFHTTRLSFSGMKERGWGRIINIASAHGLTASPFKSAYVASKHGLLGLTKTVALEGAEFGVCVNAICPGYVETPLVMSQIADTALARGMDEKDVIKNVILERQPTKSFTKVEHIADMAAFLMSESASNITGAELKMDGGWTAL